MGSALATIGMVLVLSMSAVASALTVGLRLAAVRWRRTDPGRSSPDRRR